MYPKPSDDSPTDFARRPSSRLPESRKSPPPAHSAAHKNRFARKRCFPSDLQPGIMPRIPTNRPPIAIRTSTPIRKGSGSEKAGIQENDIVIGINGTVISNISELNEIKNKCKVGDTVQLTIYRNKKMINVDVVLGESTEDTSESNDNDQNNNNNNNNNDDYNDYYGNYGNGLGGYNYGYGF